MTPLLDINDLSVVYQTHRGPLTAVDQVSFKLVKGQSLGLVGESGSGKSTIGAAIMGMLPDNAKVPQGRIHFGGSDLLRCDAKTLQQTRWSQIAMIFQAAMNALNPIQRVGDQIIEAICVHEPQTSRQDARNRVLALYDQVGIPHQRIDDYPHQYSGGMRQRAIIAMALACRPSIIIADEPTTALDVLVQDQILKTIQTLQEDMGIAILYISHDISVIADVCHHIGVMYAGQLVEIGTRQEVFDAPGHPYTQALLAAHITLEDDGAAPQPIPGSSPDMCQLFAGCRFCDRCACSGDTCSLDAPAWNNLSQTHRVRCCK